MIYENVACLTIVSKNYLSMARVLCSSFLKHHPGARFYVVLVDKNEGYIDIEKEDFILIEIQDSGIPAPDIFPYQYNILELNTAVKPFALKQLLQDQSIEKIAYIDPDICIYRPLDEVWGGLEDHSVVITPHMREPFGDNCSPSELAIIQSGTYNLGFIALKNDKTARKLLDWWSERLYLDCVVDVPRGLFTDQKWIDLVPAYFDSVLILRCPSFNVAYWNLHERRLTKEEGRFHCEKAPLAFFHFSGYSARKPRVLSKHQNRHQIDDYPELEAIFSEYRDALIDAGFYETSKWPYAFKCLDNCVKLSDPVHYVIRRCLEKGLAFPSPSAQPDDFCEFLMTPNRAVSGHGVAPLVTGILYYRPDLRTAFPKAASDRLDDGFRNWLNLNGKYELGLEELVMGWGHCLARKNSVIALVDIYHSRRDLIVAHPEAFTTPAGLLTFQEWARLHACIDHPELETRDIARFCAATAGVWKVLNLFYGRLDLQKSFRNLGAKGSANAFREWALNSLEQMPNISEDEIEFFAVWMKHNNSLISRINLAYNAWIRECVDHMPNIFSAPRFLEFCEIIHIALSAQEISQWLVQDFMPSPIQHLAAYYQAERVLQRRFPAALKSQEECLQLIDHVLKNTDVLEHVEESWIHRLKAEAGDLERLRERVNVAGYLNATTGIGESGRSMVAILQAGGKEVECYALPSVFTNQNDIDLDPSGIVFGRVNLLADTTVIVANADSTVAVNSLYPSKLIDGKKIGYWVWETESLPSQWAPHAVYYDDIWSPSRYSAAAIERTINRPVKVVPHAVNIPQPEQIRGDRERFGLPQDAFIFGYFFDQKSFPERKNPEGVIAAFEAAFKGHENVYLLMKVNTPKPGDFRYQRLKSLSKSKNIIWFEDSLSREDLLIMLKSLDAYISLHRSEGFGLTMAEAMALGIPTIGSAYSGNLDFMNEKNAFLVKTERRIIGKNIGPYRGDCYWGEPSIDDAAQKMREVFGLQAEDNMSRLKLVELRPELIAKEFLQSLR